MPQRKPLSWRFLPVLFVFILTAALAACSPGQNERLGTDALDHNQYDRSNVDFGADSVAPNITNRGGTMEDRLGRNLNPNFRSLTGHSPTIHGEFYRGNDTAYARKRNADGEQMVRAAKKVNGVKEAAVVVTGNTAYVGVALQGSIPPRQARQIEENVAYALARLKPQYRILITSERTVYDRLRDVGNGLRGGTPVNNYRTDLEEMARKMRAYR
ncbi:hypothetical protein BSNK01_17140 [Bacillaceae bacterium]